VRLIIHGCWLYRNARNPYKLTHIEIMDIVVRKLRVWRKSVINLSQSDHIYQNLLSLLSVLAFSFRILEGLCDI